MSKWTILTVSALSVSPKTLFLKNRKGDLLKVNINGSISMETWDEVRSQAQTVSLPWVESGDAEGLPIVLTPSDATFSL